jgi:hypothetical protein
MLNIISCKIIDPIEYPVKSYHVPLVQAVALPEEFVGADVVGCFRRRWPTMAGRRWGNSGLVAPTSHCSVQCVSERRHRRKSERRHRRKTLILTGMELVEYCTQEDSLHLRLAEVRRQKLVGAAVVRRTWRRGRRTGWTAVTYVRVGKGRKIHLIPVSLATCEADVLIAVIVANFVVRRTC